MNKVFHSDVPLEDYVSDRMGDVPSLNSGTIHTILTQSLAHAWQRHPRLNPDRESEESTRLDIGSAMHDAFLLGSEKIAVIEADDWRKKEAKQARDEARAEGKIPMLTKHAARVIDAARVAKEFLAESEAKADYESEVTMLWEMQGVLCRGRADMLSVDRKWLIEYKSVMLAEPSVVARLANRMGYFEQLQFYASGVWALSDGVMPRQAILAQEIAPPYACSLVAPDVSVQALSHARIALVCKMWREALESNQWPAYGPRLHYASANAYDVADIEEMQSETSV